MMCLKDTGHQRDQWWCNIKRWFYSFQNVYSLTLRKSCFSFLSCCFLFLIYLPDGHNLWEKGLFWHEVQDYSVLWWKKWKHQELEAAGSIHKNREQWVCAVSQSPLSGNTVLYHSMLSSRMDRSSHIS